MMKKELCFWVILAFFSIIYGVIILTSIKHYNKWMKAVGENENNEYIIALALADTTVEFNSAKDNYPSMFKWCPRISPNVIVGRSRQGNSFNFSLPPKTEKQLEEDNPMIRRGGAYCPENCIPKYRVAVIIPFRNREAHLLKFLQYMHPLFQRKQMNYKIYIINEIDGVPFNRAKLMNVGFVESLKDGYDCFVFHDVDMILEDDRCAIRCNTRRPVHLGAYLHRWNYDTEYAVGEKHMGGVAQFSKEQFIKINGMSNSYWGWGGEDDDVYSRTVHEKLRVLRYKFCRYRMINHDKEQGNMPNPDRFRRIKRTMGYKNDGLNNLHYEIVAREEHRLYTNITVDLYAPKDNVTSSEEV